MKTILLAALMVFMAHTAPPPWLLGGSSPVGAIAPQAAANGETQKKSTKKNVIQKNVIQKNVIQDSVIQNVIQKNVIQDSVIQNVIQKNVIQDSVIQNVIQKNVIQDSVIQNVIHKYKLQMCNVDYSRLIDLNIDPFTANYRDVLSNLTQEEKAKSCFSSSTYGDSVYSYSYGVEQYVTTGYIYDNFGNKLEQKEKQLVGLVINVQGEKGTFDYLENKKMRSNIYFQNARMNLTAEYTTTQKKCSLWVLCEWIEKKQMLFVELIREKQK